MAMTDEEELQAMMDDLGGDDVPLGELGTEEVEETEDGTEEFTNDNDESEEDEREAGESEEIEISEDESEDDNGTESSGDEEEFDKGLEEESTEPDFKPMTVTVAGQEITIDSAEELMKYVNAGAGTFGKEAKQETESERLLKEGNISADTLKLVIEAQNGNPEAIAMLAKKSNVDILDLDSESADNYSQKQSYDAPTDLEYARNEVRSNPELAQKIVSISEHLPASFTDAIVNNASDLRAFSGQVQSGLAQKIIPEAIKLSMKEGTSFMESYIKIGTEMSQNPEQKQSQPRRESDAMKKIRARAGAGTGSKARTSKVDANDIWNMSDADFQKEINSGN